MIYHQFVTIRTLLKQSLFFLNFLLDDISKHHVIKVEHAQTKSGNGAIGYRRIKTLGRNDPTVGYVGIVH